jgi:hypothetical protein
MVIIDLEDAVSPANKATAREALANAQLDPARVVVRINAVTSSEHAADMAALRRTAFRTVMLAKAESPDQLEDLPGWDVVVLLETPRGITHAHTIAASPGVVGVMWGAEDLIAALGGRSSRYPDGGYRDVAAMPGRSRCSPPARTAGRPSTRCTSPSTTSPGWRARPTMPPPAASPTKRASTRARRRSSGKPSGRHRRKSPGPGGSSKQPLPAASPRSTDA